VLKHPGNKIKIYYYVQFQFSDFAAKETARRREWMEKTPPPRNKFLTMALMVVIMMVIPFY